jgi:hypothetical protein
MVNNWDYSHLFLSLLKACARSLSRHTFGMIGAGKPDATAAHPDHMQVVDQFVV